MAKLNDIYQLEMKSVITSSTLDDTELRLFPYRLYAIASHSGSLYDGQYVSYVKQGEEWRFANDVYYSNITKKQALDAEAYLLFYQRLW